MSTPSHDEPTPEAINAAMEILRKDLPATREEPADEVDAETEEVPIPEELTFSTAGRTPDPDADGDVLELVLDGTTLYAKKPKGGAWTMLIGAMSNSATDADRTQAMLQFVNSAFDRPSQLLLTNRLLDSEDPLEIDVITTIIEALLKKWSPEQSRAERRKALGRRRVPAR